MLRWKSVAVLAVVLLVSGCGQWRATALRWPAKLVSIEGLDSMELAAVQGNIDDLNEQLGLTLLLQGESGSDIFIKRVQSFDSHVNLLAHTDTAYVGIDGMRGATGTKIAGRATLSNWSCTIELADFLFAKNKTTGEMTAKALLLAVLWHEIGHCGGLPHVEEAGELMSPITLPFSSYSDAKIQRFFTDLLNSTGSR